MKDQITIAQLLASRHSVRKFQPDFKISDEDLNLILEAARMAPSSFGILNSRVIAIENNQMRRELLPLFFYQESFKQSSAYLLFIVDKGQFILSESIFKAEKYIQSPETMTKYQIDLANIVGMWDDKFNKLTGLNPEQWSIAQAYVSLTAALIQAEQLGIDSTPHEGFKKDQLEAYLATKGYLNPEKETVAIGLALGKADVSKPHAINNEKVRKTMADYAVIIK